MTDPKPCTTCALHYSGRCADSGAPVEAARADRSLCGPDGSRHSPAPARELTDRWIFWVAATASAGLLFWLANCP